MLTDLTAFPTRSECSVSVAEDVGDDRKGVHRSTIWRNFPEDVKAGGGGVIVTRANFDALKALFQEDKLQTFDQLLDKSEPELPPYEESALGVVDDGFRERAAGEDSADAGSNKKMASLLEGDSGAQRSPQINPPAKKQKRENESQRQSSKSPDGVAAGKIWVEEGLKDDAGSSAAGAVEQATPAPMFHRVNENQFVFDLGFVTTCRESVLNYELQVTNYYARYGEGDSVAPGASSKSEASSRARMEMLTNFVSLSRARDEALSSYKLCEEFGQLYQFHYAERLEQRPSAVDILLHDMDELGGRFQVDDISPMEELIRRTYGMQLRASAKIPAAAALPRLAVEVCTMGGDRCFELPQAILHGCQEFLHHTREYRKTSKKIKGIKRIVINSDLKDFNTKYRKDETVPDSPSVWSKLTLDIELQHHMREALEAQIAAAYENLICAPGVLGSSCSTRSAAQLFEDSDIIKTTMAAKFRFPDVLPLPVKKDTSDRIDLQWDIGNHDDMYRFAHDLRKAVDKADTTTAPQSTTSQGAGVEIPSVTRGRDLEKRGGGYVVANLLTAGLLQLWLLDDGSVRHLLAAVDTKPSEGGRVPSDHRLLPQLEPLHFNLERDEKRCRIPRLGRKSTKGFPTTELKKLVTGDLVRIGHIRGTFGWRCVPCGDSRALLLRLDHDEWLASSVKRSTVAAESQAEIDGAVECEKRGAPSYEDVAKLRCEEMQKRSPWRAYVCVEMPGAAGAPSLSSSSTRDSASAIAGYLLVPTGGLSTVCAEPHNEERDRNLMMRENKRRENIPSSRCEQLDEWLLNDEIAFHPQAVGMFISANDHDKSGMDLLSLREKQLGQAKACGALPPRISYSGMPESVDCVTRFATLLEARKQLAVKKIDWFRNTYPAIFFEESPWKQLRKQLHGCIFGVHSLAQPIIAQQLADSFDEQTAAAAGSSTSDDQAEEPGEFQPAIAGSEDRPGFVFKEHGNRGPGYYKKGSAATSRSSPGKQEGLQIKLTPRNPWRRAVPTGEQALVKTEKNRLHPLGCADPTVLPLWWADGDEAVPDQNRVIARVSPYWRFTPTELVDGVSADLRTFESFFDYAAKLHAALPEGEGVSRLQFSFVIAEPEDDEDAASPQARESEDEEPSSSSY
ncbi:unnamed protein product [Amoebophrya sp. A120]|nr:unnamed protein product [Amoebophrya sp. A120]|eukprot:GSA120T00009407001.1